MLFRSGAAGLSGQPLWQGVSAEPAGREHRLSRRVSLGQASGALQPISPDQLAQKSATFSRPVIFAYLAAPGQLAECTQRLWAALADGSIHKPTIERYTLDGASQHMRGSSRGSRVGPLILVV